MRNTFNVLIYANGSKQRDGLLPLLCRITVNGTIAQFSCKLNVPVPLWDPKSGKAVGKSREASRINLALDSIKSRIFSIYQGQALQGKVRSAVQIRELYFGHGLSESTLLDAMDRQSGAIASRVGNDRAASTLCKYRVVRKHIEEYIHEQLHQKDVFLSDLDEDFIRGFCVYLREKVGVSQSSVWVYQMPLRTVATAAFNEGLISKNPFTGFHVSPDVREREFLSEEQLRVLMNWKFPEGSVLERVRDFFVFCCFTGLSFVDLKNLSWSDIVEVNGTQWIISRRQKTKVHFQAKLLPVALGIMERWGAEHVGQCEGSGRGDGVASWGGGRQGTIFNVGNYCTENLRLKRVGRLSWTSGNLTFHQARHTFATLALSKGMSMESLRSILGHTDLHTTQIYAKITAVKLEKDYSRVAEGLAGMW